MRAIARETDIDVKAIQMQLKRLENINVLSSTLKGRNKEYSLNLNNSITNYYIMLAETFSSINYLERNFLIKKIISEVKDRIEGVIILFGSFVKGEATKESDIDMFVLTEKINKDAFTEVSNLIGREINVKSTNKKEFLRGLEDSDPLIMEVILNHIILKGIDDFCDIMWRYYAK